MNKYLWRFVDPLLLRLRSRLEHLEEHSPSSRLESALREKAAIARSVQFGPGAAILNRGPASAITIGDHSFVMGSLETLGPEAKIALGHHCFLGPNSFIWSAARVDIGNYVLIAHLVDVFDNDSHSLNWRERRLETDDKHERRLTLAHDFVARAPVTIEDDVWIGSKSTILKGVKISRGAVVAAGTTVTKDVPPFTMVAGNPARVIRQLDQE